LAFCPELQLEIVLGKISGSDQIDGISILDLYLHFFVEELRNLLIHDIGGGGVSGGAMAITVYNLDQKTSRRQLIIDNCTLYDCEPAWSEALTLNGNIEQFQVTNNRVYNINNIGIDFIGMCLNNTCHNF
jgi:hypothetical protein